MARLKRSPIRRKSSSSQPTLPIKQKYTRYENARTKEHNTEENRNAYYASQAAYGQSDYHQKLLKGGYVHDIKLSGTHQQVYYNPKTKHALVGFRGTSVGKEGANSDLSADLAIAKGTYRNHEAFTNANSLVANTIIKYGRNVTTTGHSLGGTKSINAANTHKVKAIAFNPGTGLHLDAGSQTVFHRRGDTISTRVYGENVHRLETNPNLAYYASQAIWGGNLYRENYNHSLSGFEPNFS